MQENSESAFESALHKLNKKNEPVVWTSARDSLGDKIASSSQEENEIVDLKKQVEALSSELEQFNQDESPKKWAYSQYSRAIKLHLLGLQGEGVQDYLNDAVEAYKKVLTVWKRPEVPLDWTTTMNKIGMVFQVQGDLLKNAHTVKMSVAAFNNALTVLTHEEVPLEWAITYNNLGVSYQLIGVIDKDVKMLVEAIESFESALQILTPENNPVGWLVVMANIAAARNILATLTKDIDIAKKSVADSESIVGFLADVSNAEYLTLAKEEKERSKALLEGLG